jgi:hypothetical protein
MPSSFMANQTLSNIFRWRFIHNMNSIELINIKEPHGRLARWVIYLQSYNFNIIDRPGIQHINADAMSRIDNIEMANIIQNEKSIDHSQKSLDVWEDSTLLYFLKNLKHKPGASKKQVKRINEKI